jgi:hypothetical protein
LRIKGVDKITLDVGESTAIAFQLFEKWISLIEPNQDFNQSLARHKGVDFKETLEKKTDSLKKKL